MEWQGRNGYGMFGHKWEDVSYLAHRIAWFLTHGPIPNGLSVLHKNECHNRACVDPDHLYLGTQKDNVDDAKALGMYKKNDEHKRRLSVANRGKRLSLETRSKIGAKVRQSVANRRRDNLGRFISQE